ncbi:class II aldolase/adducin family protein [Patulibacter minatonensis]|uniref:class II aldolase/adducin family protein n=1 Tax=Patulibacter minatonensis TaxID=298163 RepID=UPI000688B3DC|nr:class II aldolase/adducin family protein [Patulibacter minatonensis]
MPGRRRSRRARIADHALLRGAAEVARTLEPEGLVVGTVGNVSVRTGPTVHVTPTRTGYAAMCARDLVMVDVASGVVLGAGTPSRELPLHLAVYRARPDVGCVLHTHSVAATAWSFLDEPLQPELEDLAYHGIAPVRTSPHADAGTEALATAAATTLGPDTAVLLGRHGVLTVGATPADALLAARVVERQARVAWLVRGAAPWATGVASAVLDDVAGSSTG